MENSDRMELISKLELDSHLDYYKIVDFLNKNLKDLDIVFGLAKKGDHMILSIYKA